MVRLYQTGAYKMYTWQMVNLMSIWISCCQQGCIMGNQVIYIAKWDGLWETDGSVKWIEWSLHLINVNISLCAWTKLFMFLNKAEAMIISLAYFIKMGCICEAI